MMLYCTNKQVSHCTNKQISHNQTTNISNNTTNETHHRAGKVGGAATLSSTQANLLERQQIMEFKRRYNNSSSSSPSSKGSRMPGNYTGRSSLDTPAELVLCMNCKGECIGCAGVEGEFVFLYVVVNLILFGRRRRRGG